MERQHERDGAFGDDGAVGGAAGEVTRLLAAWRAGDESSMPRLVEVVHDLLRRQARAQLRKLRPGETLGTTALVNEAYVKLVGHGAARDRSHFFAIAATAMRHVLVDHARAKMAGKRGEGQKAQTLEEQVHLAAGGAGGVVEAQAVSLLDLHGALERLARRSPRLARVVECRFFGGMTEPQIAEALDVTDRTVRRDWIKARAWLYRELASHGSPTDSDQAEVSPDSKPSPKRPSSA